MNYLTSCVHCPALQFVLKNIEYELKLFDIYRLDAKRGEGLAGSAIKWNLTILSLELETPFGGCMLMNSRGGTPFS